MGMTLRPSTTAASGALAAGTSRPSRLLGGGLQGHGQDALDGPGLAGEGQLADDGERAGPLEGDLAAAQEQAQGDRQVEPAGVLLEVGRGQVDDDPVDRPAVSRVDDRPLDPVRALADGRLGQADQDRLGLDGERDVNLDFDRGRVDSDERVRGELGEHGRFDPRRERLRSRAMRHRPARDRSGGWRRFYHELMDCSPPDGSKSPRGTVPVGRAGSARLADPLEQDDDHLLDGARVALEVGDHHGLGDPAEPGEVVEGVLQPCQVEFPVEDTCPARSGACIRGRTGRR